MHHSTQPSPKADTDGFEVEEPDDEYAFAKRRRDPTAGVRGPGAVACALRAA
ncbi:hypothetical protein ACFVFT_00685 [Streptomyces tendae]|uniref:hypothetical protein n=1 Tax=Streptomyces tendae TaxID=1932 RepID=UPI00369AED7C